MAPLGVCGCDLNGEVIHPHMQPKLTMVSMELIFNEYHMGRKYDVTTGKKVFEPPTAGPWQILPLEFEWSRAVMKEVIEAPSLQEAVVLAGVRPFSLVFARVSLVFRVFPVRRRLVVGKLRKKQSPSGTN